MIPMKAAVLLGSALLFLQGCCELPRGKECEHHIEPPFVLKGGSPAVGLVYGTADFNGGGSVLIKVQVEDKNSPIHVAKVKIWTGTSDPTTLTSTTPPPGGQPVSITSDDVSLRYWTTHIDRQCPVGSTNYWVYVRVDYRNEVTGSYTSRCLLNSWSPVAGQPDEPHDFADLGAPPSP